MTLSNQLKKLKRKAGWTTNDLLWSLRIKNQNFANIPFQRIVIYHGIDDAGNNTINSRFISKINLEKQFRYYTANFHVVSVSDYFEGKFHPTKPTIAITFDDGYANNYSHAFPLLLKYNLPASIYVTTISDANQDILWPDYLDVSVAVCTQTFSFREMNFAVNEKNVYVDTRTKLTLKEYFKQLDFPSKLDLMKQIPGGSQFKNHQELDVYWKLLSENQIIEMSKSPLITFGSHGYYHNSLDKIQFEAAKEEILKSKRYLENLISKPVDEMAYPDGTYTPDLIEYAASVGISKQLLAGRRTENECDARLIRTRVTMNPHISFNNQMQTLVNGPL